MHGSNTIFLLQVVSSAEYFPPHHIRLAILCQPPMLQNVSKEKCLLRKPQDEQRWISAVDLPRPNRKTVGVVFFHNSQIIRVD